MATVSTVFSVPNLQGTYLGLEVELEGVDIEARTEDDEVDYDYLSTELVRCIKDGSLRNYGAEFIFDSPLLFGSDDFLKALDEIQEIGASFQAVSSPRTSCHVHLNVSDLDVDQLQRVLYLSLCLEPVLMKYCSEYRQHNRFCLPSYKSYDYINSVRNGLRAIRKDGRYSRDYFQNCTKYAAISLHRLPSLGTIEYRMFDGTYDKDKLQSICKIVNTIRRIGLNRSIEEIKTAKVQGTLYRLLGSEISETFNYVSEQEFLALFEKGAVQANDLLLDTSSIHQKVIKERQKHASIRRELEQRKYSESRQREGQSAQGTTPQQDLPVPEPTPPSGADALESWYGMLNGIRRGGIFTSSAESTRPSPSSEQQAQPPQPPTRRRTLSQRATLDDMPRDSEAVDSREQLEGGSESYTLGA